MSSPPPSMRHPLPQAPSADSRAPIPRRSASPIRGPQRREGGRDVYIPSRDPYGPDRRRRSRSPISFRRSPPPHHSRSRSRSRSPAYRRRRSPSYSPIRDRSRSPRYGRDRYDRRDSYRDGGRDSRRPGGGGDPEGLEGVLPYKAWMEWFRTAEPDQYAIADQESTAARRDNVYDKVGLQLLYEKYRKSFVSRQLWALYLTHKDCPWFIERYSPDPSIIEARKKISRKGKAPAVVKYLEELEKGEWDGICYEVIKDVPVEVKEGEDVKMEEDTKEVEAKLVKRAPDAGVVTSEKDVIEIQPGPDQIFIKSLPPTFSRADVEKIFEDEGGFEYIALGDPVAKRNWARVGWVQFAPGTDVDRIVRTVNNKTVNDFIMHVVKNTSPFIGRIRYNPPSSNTTSRLLKDWEQARALAIAIETDLVLPSDEKTTLEEMVDDVATPVVQTEGDHLSGRGSARVAKRIEEVLARLGLSQEEGLGEEQKHERARIGADMFISYLREGLHTCYYCVASTDFVEEMHRKCIRHVRHNLDTVPIKVDADGDADMDNDEDGGKKERMKYLEDLRWADAVDMGVKVITAPDSVDPLDYSGKSREEEVKKIAKPLTKYEEAQKYRCKTCQKLFKAPEFVHKHIPAKHPEVFATLDLQLPVFNNFALDPARIVPHHRQPASVDDRLPTASLVPPAAQASMPVSEKNGAQSMSARNSNRPRYSAILPSNLAPPGKLDPRAAGVAVKYDDLDAPASGAPADGGLPY